jgi:hypothetical protein
VALAGQSDGEGLVSLSVDSIAAYAGIGDRTAGRALRWLTAHRYLVVVRAAYSNVPPVYLVQLDGTGESAALDELDELLSRHDRAAAGTTAHEMPGTGAATAHETGADLSPAVAALLRELVAEVRGLRGDVITSRAEAVSLRAELVTTRALMSGASDDAIPLRAVGDE